MKRGRSPPERESLIRHFHMRRPLYQVIEGGCGADDGRVSIRFTNKQKRTAYDIYEPRTAHDSSLSYAPHSILAAQIGRTDEAYRYFCRSACLDIEDTQLNTVSGLHILNFGGTWQAVYRVRRRPLREWRS